MSVDEGLQGRVALVTGGAKGIGRAITGALVDAGCRVAIAGRDRAALDGVVAELDGGAGEVAAFEGDVGDVDATDVLVTAVEERWGPVAVLVNNAGITKDGLLLRMSVEDWDSVLAVNLRSAFLLSKRCARGMMKARWGRIINMSSVVGIMGNAGQANYVASKAGLIGLTRSLARELASRSITVNAVAPGFIETAMTAAIPDEAMKEMTARIPLGRTGHAEDVAGCVRFLTSEAASYITGQVIQVDGGLVMG